MRGEGGGWSPDSYKNNFGDRQKKGVQTCCHGGFHGDTHACKKSALRLIPMPLGGRWGEGWRGEGVDWLQRSSDVMLITASRLVKSIHVFRQTLITFPPQIDMTAGQYPPTPHPLSSHPIRQADVINQGTLPGWHRGSTTTPRPARVGTCLLWPGDFCRMTAAKGGQTRPCVQSSISADALLCLTWTEHIGAEPQQSEQQQQQQHRPSHGPPGTPAPMSDTAWTKAATSSICFSAWTRRDHSRVVTAVLWTGIVFRAENSQERASSRL